ncbi:MAG: bifunctional N(6)-L-threonylcarbamoyladenine synthase/serine/threonine protein kinase [archaeon]|nr:bifunctional N(6)-L-threonylcarbamoyladenine synthase/serine/threonine protein kinase [archaeon]MDA1168339.1 bifunctional N(6)-L-threonylcarbamoyladenine synthase/serine/threonine protein kinase [archaeon]
MNGWTVGIETTAHTFSFGLVDSKGIPYPSTSDTIKPEKGGIHPREAADHHKDFAAQLFRRALESQNLSIDDISAISYSQGPGLGPCLRVGAAVARSLSTALDVPLIGVNHCVAHIEIGRQQCGCNDPVLLYVSGGNTQVIARLNGRYRVLGETLDIGIGNMLDKFARSNGIPFPGGPVIEKLALQYLERVTEPTLEGLELPYAVRGMDLAFSGLMTAAQRLVENGQSLDAVCWSLQEHAFAACIEVAERALAHTGKSEVLLGGGVACNERMRTMSNLMAEERGGRSYVPPKMYCIDNGTMIARLGWLELEKRTTELHQSAIDQYLRTDQTPIVWT